MCQCVLCDCIWWNYCGACAGCANLNCCYGWWCCQQDELKRSIGADTCCWCCQFVGLGSNFLCNGCVTDVYFVLSLGSLATPTHSQQRNDCLHPFIFLFFLFFSLIFKSYHLILSHPSIILLFFHSFSKTSRLYQVNDKNNTTRLIFSKQPYKFE